MVAQEINKAIEVLKKSDKQTIREILSTNKHHLDYDAEYCGWTIKGEYIVDYLFKEYNTYLNPKELESTVDELIEDEILPISQIAEDFISYFESKYGLEDITVDRICSNIDRDCEFHNFESLGLSDEVIKQLKEQGVDIK